MVAKIDRLGETRMMNCGMEATIIRYGNATDIDVRFEDGAVTKHKAYKEFGNGKIANPNVKDRLGEARMMNCGMKATIARYNGVRDIDVRFEDGIVMEHKSYSKFKRGNIAHPSTTAGNRLGETRMMNCGMEATIIPPFLNASYALCSTIAPSSKQTSISVLFPYRIAHRSLSLSHGSKDFHGFICKQGFKDEDRVLYECICKHCGLEDVLTPQEMMEHEKLEHGEDK